MCRTADTWSYMYTLGGIPLAAELLQKDPGVIISDTLKPSAHITSITKKANQRIGIIKRCLFELLLKWLQEICVTFCDMFIKGWVHIRKSKSGGKCNKEFVNDAYWVLSYRCCTSKLFSCKYQILHHGCALKRENGHLKQFAEIDAF